jgi:Flp pilus assembly protein TadD
VTAGHSYVHRGAEVNAGELRNAYTALVVTLLRNNQAHDALFWARTAVERFPGEADFHHNLGLAHGQKGEHEEAIRHYRKATALNPQNHLYHANLGRSLLQTGKADEALPHLMKVVEVRPNDVHAHRWVVTALFESNRWDEAAETLRAAISLEPKDASAYADLASITKRLRRWEETTTAYRKAIDLDSANPRYHRYYSWFLATCPEKTVRDPARAVEHAERAVQLDSKDLNCWSVLGVARYRVGEWKAAIEALDTVDRSSRGMPAVHTPILAMSYWQAGQKDKAEFVLELARKMVGQWGPKNDDFERLLAEAEALIGTQLQQPLGEKK